MTRTFGLREDVIAFPRANSPEAVSLQLRPCQLARRRTFDDDVHLANRHEAPSPEIESGVRWQADLDGVDSPTHQRLDSEQNQLRKVHRVLVGSQPVVDGAE